MNYEETITYLFSRLPVFQRDGQSAYKPGLYNTEKFDVELGHPHRKYKTIHVAGTNGKGSVSHLLASVLQHAGYKVGLYTSPHLKDFRERIRINGEPISKEYVCEFTEEHKAFVEKLNPSFFELTMSMAFKYFADEKVDVAVIEVGLGGRLDSTNIITPVLSVITNISFDHMNYLGNTLTAIASEKAGIIKPQIPIIIGEATGEIKQVFIDKAQEQDAPIIFAEDETTVKVISTENGRQVFDCTNFSLLTIGLGGNYQLKNTATTLTAIQQIQLLGFNLSKESIYKGFETVCETTGLQGRWQKIQDNPSVICDTGHNEGGIRYIVEQLQSLPYKQLRMVIGMVNDKDLSKVLSLLPSDAKYYFCKASIPRALNEKEVQHQAEEFGIQGDCFPTVQMALDKAKQDASIDDLIFIGGSTFVVAEIL